VATTAIPFKAVRPRARAAADDPYRNRYLIALTVTLASILELLDTSIVNVAVPHMMGTLGATLDQIAWVSTGYVVANVIVLPITGWLSARFGRRRYFAASIALFTLASFFCGNAHTLQALVFWRIVQGVGGGALLSTSQSILYEVFPREEFGTAMAIFGMGVMVGPTLGPTLGGYITDALSWPWIFYINVPLGMIALAMTLGFIRDSRFAQKVEAVDWLGLGLLIAGIGCLQTMLERGERLDWFDSREVLLYAVVSAVSLVWFVIHELRTEHPIVDLRILKNRQFAAGITFAAMLGCCLYATVFVLPVYLQTLLGFTAEQTGFVILPGALASAFTMAAMARLGAKVDGRVLVVCGVAIFGASMWMHGHFTTESGQHDFFWPLILRGMGLGLIFVPMTNLALAELPMEKIPNGTGLYNLTRQLGGSIGIAVTATLISRFRDANYAALSEHVSRYGEATRERLAMLTSAMVSKGTPVPLAETKAIEIIQRQVMGQAAMLSYEHLFLLFGLGMVMTLPLLLLMRQGRGRAGGMAH
jgi:DHA2 family multidrug resistance protein